MFRRKSVLTFAVALTCAAGIQAQDSCAVALVIGDGVTAGSNVGATTGPDPVGSCGAMGNDVWYAYVASCTGNAVATFCAPGSAAYDPVLAAWSGTCGSLVQLACNDDTCGLMSQISFPVVAGTTYYVSVGGFSGSTGTFNLSMGCLLPLANDSCATATSISEGILTPGSNIGSSTGPDPIGGCGGMGNDVWYVVVPSCNGPYSASTCNAGTGYDTVLAVWDGTAGCGGLVNVACNDDNCNTQFLSSTATWTATAGTPYYISVGGYFGSTGTFVLSVNSGAGIALNFINSGPGTLGYQVVGGPSGGTAFTALTLIPGAYPNDWFFGIAITLADLTAQIFTGYPFAAPLSPCGDVVVGPFGGLPSGLTVYGVSLGIPLGGSTPTTVSAPASATVP